MRVFALLTTWLLLVLAAPALAQDEAGGAQPEGQDASTQQTGGAAYGVDPEAPPEVYVPGTQAVLMDNGYAAAPADAPVQVQQAIFAANRIVGKPYVYGGGHRAYKSSGYDCSGTVSYALHGGGLLKRPLYSSSFMRWGQKGPGAWITVYTNPGHAFAVIAGLRLDTSTAGRVSRAIARTSERGPRWRVALRKVRGFAKRHPVGF